MKKTSMYEGTNQTALTSQKNIAEAFVRLLRTTPYAKISISAICKEAGVSRQTFYSLFESRENIILYILDKKHSYHPEKHCTCSELSLEDLCKTFSQYISERSEFLSLLVANDLTYLLHDNLCESFNTCSCFMPESDETTRAFCAEFAASGLTGIIRTYIRCGQSLSQEELSRIIYHLFAGDFLNPQQ